MDHGLENRGEQGLAPAPEADADRPLFDALVRSFARAGGAVRVEPAAGNLVRHSGRTDGTSLPYIVEVEGLPNLLHEFVHFVLREPLEVDHGFDYSLIPFDTSIRQQRRWLWEELACCVVSCAYLATEPMRVAPWFAEQVGIQHHFYGFPDALSFRAHVDRLLAAHGAEMEAVLEEAYTSAERHLRAAGLADAAPARRLALVGLWEKLARELSPPRSAPVPPRAGC